MQVGQDDANQLYDGDDECSERKGARVEAEHKKRGGGGRGREGEGGGKGREWRRKDEVGRREGENEGKKYKALPD